MRCLKWSVAFGCCLLGLTFAGTAVAQAQDVINGPFEWEVETIFDAPRWIPSPGPKDPPPQAHCWDNGMWPRRYIDGTPVPLLGSVCPNSRLDHLGKCYVPMPSGDQGVCGACTLYSKVHALEVQYGILLGRDVLHPSGPLVFSIQHVVDCADWECIPDPDVGFYPIYWCASGVRQSPGVLGFGEAFSSLLRNQGLVEERFVPTPRPLSRSPSTNFTHSCTGCGLQPGGMVFHPYDDDNHRSVHPDDPEDYDQARLLIVAALNEIGPVRICLRGFGAGGCVPGGGGMYHCMIVIGYRDSGHTMIVKDSYGQDYLWQLSFDEWAPCGMSHGLVFPDPPGQTTFETFCSGDLDGDHVPNSVDNCIWVPNPNQLDSDGDGVGELCDLAPGMGYPFPLTDSDHDCVGEDSGDPQVVIDNCPGRFNPTQEDADGDGKGDLCDDSDIDGVVDFYDCDPHNWALAYDLDSDGVCDRPSAFTVDQCQYACNEGYAIPAERAQCYIRCGSTDN